MTARTRRPAAPPAAALWAALVAAVALVAGCTAPSGGSAQSTTAGPPAAAASQTSSPAASGGTSATGSAPTDMTQSSGRPTTTTSSPTAQLPGGGGDVAALAAAGDLTDDGRIDLHGATNSGAWSHQQDRAELCTFLFGTPDEIAEITRLASDLALDPISGRHAAEPSGSDPDGSGSAAAGSGAGAAGATVIACVYRIDGAPILALQVGDGPPVDPDLPGRPIIVDSGGMHAVLSYSPDHIGPTIDAARARDWLGQALARVAAGGTR